MRNFYVVFDQTNMRFGFAPLANSPKLKQAAELGQSPSCSYTTYYYGNCDASSAPASSSNDSFFSQFTPLEITIIICVVVIAWLFYQMYSN